MRQIANRFWGTPKEFAAMELVAMVSHLLLIKHRLHGPAASRRVTAFL